MFRAVGVVGLVLLSSCSQKPEEVAPKPRRAPVYIGIVDRVYPRYHYALIRLSSATPTAGTTLISQSPDGETTSRIANLIVTEERLGRLRVPADIRSGSVMPGDIVFRYQNLAEPSPHDAPANPDESTNAPFKEIPSSPNSGSDGENSPDSIPDNASTLPNMPRDATEIPDDTGFSQPVQPEFL